MDFKKMVPVDTAFKWLGHSTSIAGRRSLGVREARFDALTGGTKSAGLLGESAASLVNIRHSRFFPCMRNSGLEDPTRSDMPLAAGAMPRGCQQCA